MTQAHRACRQCNTPLVNAKRATAEFCGTPCRISWRNRRCQRGADLYDAFMSLRYDRSAAKARGIWTLMCRMAADWHAEDIEAGRQSHFRTDEVMQMQHRHNAVVGRV